MDTVSQDTARPVGGMRADRTLADAEPAAPDAPRAVPPRGDAPAWRAAGAGLCFGLASVVWSLNQHLSEWAAIGGVVGLIVLGWLCVLGLRFVVDQAEARRSVFYGGQGQAAWFLVNLLGVFQIPWMLVSGIQDPLVLVLVAAGLGIAVAVANQAIVSRSMTGRAQPEPEPVPLG